MNFLSGLPSTLRTTYVADGRLLDPAFVRFWAVAGLASALALPLITTNFWAGGRKPDLDRHYRRTRTQSSDGHNRPDLAGARGLHCRWCLHGCWARHPPAGAI